MKITVNQLRRVIKEEVSRAVRRQKLSESMHSKKHEAKLLDIVGYGELEDYEDLAELIEDVKSDPSDWGEGGAMSRVQSELEALADRFGFDLSIEKSNALTVQIMNAFFKGIDWGQYEDEDEWFEDEENEEFRSKYPGALETLEDETHHSFKFNDAWSFSEDRGKLYASSSTSGSDLVWNPVKKSWSEV